MIFPDHFYQYYKASEKLFYLYSPPYFQQCFPQPLFQKQVQGLFADETRVKTQMTDAPTSTNQQGYSKTGTPQAAQANAVFISLKVQTKIQQNYPLKDGENQVGATPSSSEVCPHDNIAKQKYLKKNTQFNLVNNVFTYICTQSKSRRAVQQLIGHNPQKIKIFYIFANNLKRINSKYISRKDIKAFCEIVPKQTHFKILSKSIKRLMVLPIRELRAFFRKLIFNYLRGSESIVSLLTSKKLCKIGLQEHFKRRRELQKYLETMLMNYNQ